MSTLKTYFEKIIIEDGVTDVFFEEFYKNVPQRISRLRARNIMAKRMNGPFA